MPIQFDNFDQQKIDRLKNHLLSMAEKGKSKYFEIFVDSLKAVPKTDEPDDFDGYEDYMTPDTEQVKVCIYNTGASPRNDQYVFLLKARTREEATSLGLHGMPVKTFSRNSISEWREVNDKKTAEQQEITDLRREVSGLNKVIDQKDEHIFQLTSQVNEAKRNGNKIGGIHLGDIVSVAVEGLIKRNADSIAKVPIIGELAGFIGQENKAIAAPSAQEENAEVSFKKKENTSQTEGQQQVLTEQEKEFIRLFYELQKYFSKDEIDSILILLDGISRDKTQLQPLLELVKEPTKK